MSEPGKEIVAVIGAGDMGHGIAEAFAIAGHQVYMKDVKKEFLDVATRRIQESLEILSRKGRVKEPVNEIMGRIHPVLEYDKIPASTRLVIEAVPEVLSLKKEVFSTLDDMFPPPTILATNTSYMSISEIASAARNAPERVVGIHFFNPVALMKAVEVVRGDDTNHETMGSAEMLAVRAGFLPIRVHADVPGFVVNRVQAPTQLLLNRVIDSGIATFNQVDAMARKMAQPMGPFETFDYVGLDVVKHGLDYLVSHLDPVYAPPAWLVELVEAGHLGKKTGKGIFDWTSGRPVIDMEDTTETISMLDLLVVQVNEAAKLVENGVVDGPGEIDIAIINGTGNKIGILGILKSDRQGVLDRLESLAARLGIDVFKPAPALETMETPSPRKTMKKLRASWKERGFID